MSESYQLIDHVLRTSFAPLLKEQGFRKEARNFRRRATESILVVNVQGSDWNSSNSARFTVNLAVHFPALVPFVDWLKHSDRPLHHNCIVSSRIGRLFPEPCDHWWRITEETDLEALGEELANAWTQFGLPWLERHSTLAAGRDWALGSPLHHKWWGAAFSLALGERDRALELFTAAIAKAAADGSSEEFCDNLRAFGLKHGLTN
jgi:hypothetical protein